MKFGIYYAYWEQQWEADYIRYIEKAARLGFDILEIAATPLPSYSNQTLRRLRDCAQANGITLTVGHGPSAAQNLGSADPEVRRNAIAFFTDILRRMELLNAHTIGGALYSYWPVDYTQPIDKAGDWGRAVEGVRTVARVARECGVDYCLEVLNRFEGYLLNTAEEAVQFVKDVGEPAAKVMLDSFHMNIEEDSLGGAIRTAGPYLGHFHIGECNRRVPGAGRMPWGELSDALYDIGYDGPVVMEPFVRMGGRVGSDIKIWHDLSCGADEAALDADARRSVEFCRLVFGRGR